MKVLEQSYLPADDSNGNMPKTQSIYTRTVEFIRRKSKTNAPIKDHQSKYCSHSKRQEQRNLNEATHFSPKKRSMFRRTRCLGRINQTRQNSSKKHRTSATFWVQERRSVSGETQKGVVGKRIGTRVLGGNWVASRKARKG